MNKLQRATDLRNNNQGIKASKLYAEIRDDALLIADYQAAAEAEHMRGVSLKSDPDLAHVEQAYISATSYYQKAGDKLGPGRVLRDWSIVYEYRQDYQKAQALMNQSIALLEAVSHEKGAGAELGISYIKQGQIRIYLDDPIYAEESIKKGIDLVGRAGHWFYLATGLMHYAELYIYKEDFLKALNYIDKSLGLFNEHRKEQHGRRLAQLYGNKAYCLTKLEVKNKEEVQNLFRLAMDKLGASKGPALDKVLKDIHAPEIIAYINQS